MPTPIRVPNPRGEMIEPPEVSASDAKNGFGRILERVAREGGVTITRRHEPVAVVIPIETYRRLAAAKAGSLETLSAEFDALLARMQAPGVGEAMERAFEMMPEELGRAAVDAAVMADRSSAPSAPGTGARPRADVPGATDATPRPTPTIFVLAGCNGAGKSSIGGAALRQAGADWSQPERGGPKDRGRQREPISATDAGQANAAARNEADGCWRAIDEKLDFAFETTLGGRTIAELLDRAPRTTAQSTSGSSASRPSTCISIGFAVAPPRAATTSRKRRCASASGADAKT